MPSQARLSRTIVGLELTVDHRGRPIRAIVTREALEALFNAAINGPDALLNTYRAADGKTSRTRSRSSR